MRVSKKLLSTAKKNAIKRYNDEGLKHVWQKTVQTAAADAAIQGGLAAIQGEDPWESVKRGAVQGALLGSGYQSLRFATNANKKTLKGNMKHIARASKVGVSRQLRAVMKHNQNVKMTKDNLGLK